MTSTPPPRLSILFTIAFLASILLFLLQQTQALGAVISPNYRQDVIRYANQASVTTCRGWGADSDDAGNFYMACPVMRDLDGNGSGDVQTPALYEMNAAGIVTRLGWLPSEYAFDDRYPIRDVGVSPDGRTAYVSVGPNTDNLGLHPELSPNGTPYPNGATKGSILRLNRQSDGSWLYDPSFKAGPFKIAGGNYWAARYVDVDASGQLYVTVNSYVYELDKTGQIVSAFGGGQTAYPGGPWVEGFDTPEGLAVSADGREILIVEQQHHLVQRWQRVGKTDWIRDTTFLIGVPSQEGDELCTTNSHLQSPYDVSTDITGDIYVMDTSCQRIQRFNSKGTYIETIYTNMGGDDMQHGMAVNWQGSILLPIEEDILVRLNPPTRPSAQNRPVLPIAPSNQNQNACPKNLRPQIKTVVTPRNSHVRRIKVTVQLQPQCQGLKIRVRGHRMGRASWTRGTSTFVSLSGWNGRKILLVDVRSPNGRFTTKRIVSTLRLSQPPLNVRRKVSIRGRQCKLQYTAKRIGSYRLLDSCATIKGRVSTVSRTRQGSLAIRLLISAQTARAIYTNAVGPTTLWVVADGLTKVDGNVKAGALLTVTASIACERDYSAAHALAVDRILS